VVRGFPCIIEPEATESPVAVRTPGGGAMLERMEGLPENVLGFEARGEVTGADYESVLIPAVDELLARRKSIRFLYHLGNEFAGFDAKAMWDDARVGLRHLAAWERVAVVTDVAWIRTAMKMFAFVMPGQVRIFSNGEMAEARRWLGEPGGADPI
jgi:hypothetical protein